MSVRQPDCVCDRIRKGRSQANNCANDSGGQVITGEERAGSSTAFSGLVQLRITGGRQLSLPADSARLGRRQRPVDAAIVLSP